MRSIGGRHLGSASFRVTSPERALVAILSSTFCLNRRPSLRQMLWGDRDPVRRGTNDVGWECIGQVR